MTKKQAKHEKREEKAEKRAERVIMKQKVKDLKEEKAAVKVISVLNPRICRRIRRD